MSNSIALDLELGQFGTPFPINFYINGPIGSPIDTGFAIAPISQPVITLTDFKQRAPVNIWRVYLGEDGNWFEIPVSSLKVQKNYDQSSIVDASIPAANQYISEIDARRDLNVWAQGGVIIDGTEQLFTVALAPIDEISYSFRPEEVTCSIRSTTQAVVSPSYTIWYVDYDVFGAEIVDNDLEDYSGSLKYQINPGDLVGLNTGGLSYTFIVGTVTYSVGSALATMTVQHLATQASIKAAEIALSGTSKAAPSDPAKTTAEMSGWVFSIDGGSGQVVQGPRSTRLTF